jgi:hypothetical protein
VNSIQPTAEAGVPKNFRRLKPDELVIVGDFVGDGGRGLELWEGPNGFRADSFIKAIYRNVAKDSIATKKTR